MNTDISKDLISFINNVNPLVLRYIYQNVDEYINNLFEEGEFNFDKTVLDNISLFKNDKKTNINKNPNNTNKIEKH